MVATFFLTGLAFAAEQSYCEPCTDETVDGISWTSGVLNNNYEYDGTTRRNDDYKVLVKQSCASGFTGTATRICDGNGAWKNADLSGCKSDPCNSVPADFEDYLNVNNAAMKTNCPKGSKGGFECDVVCQAGFHPVVSMMKCYGGEWISKGIACQPEPVDGETESTKEPATEVATQKSGDSDDEDSDDGDNGEKTSKSAPIGIIVAVGAVLAVLLVAGYFLYSSKSKKTNAVDNLSNSGSSRSHRQHHQSNGSRRGRSVE